ncbi:MAG: hypothetical protein A2Y33_11665 [Spirochaetes bacterium GWF1_51_8]|nr:MAG: hypothetical protein A2Y33_11665 [Spirochaetes bacterium GWF1_51_8]
MVVLHAVVKGRVQGVGYRYYTERSAKARGLTGWVKNLYTGDVEVSAYGSDDAIREFTEDLRRGPFFSNVTDIDYTIENAESDPFGSFDVRF